MKAIGSSLIAFVAILAPLGACGGDDDNEDSNDVTVPDAKPSIDAPVVPDAFVLPPGCDYAEQNDTGNDAFTSMGADIEQTQYSFTGTATVCGAINGGHFIAPAPGQMYGLVDYDAFQFTVAQDTEAFVTLTGTGFDDDVLPVSFFVGGGSDRSAFAAGSYIVRDARAVGAGKFPAGEYVIVVAASSKVAVAGDHAYKVKITTETNPNCVTTLTPTASFAEAADLASNRGNDTISIPRTGNATLTAGDDAPEVTGHAASISSVLKITGNSAATAATPITAYWDGDTYEFTTGANVNQARIRLEWPAVMPTNADLDFYLYKKPTGTTLGEPLIVGGDNNAAMNGRPEEFEVTSLEPSTTYWIFVGGYRGQSTAATPVVHATPAEDHIPQTYTLQVCGDTFNTGSLPTRSSPSTRFPASKGIRFVKNDRLKTRL